MLAFLFNAMISHGLFTGGLNMAIIQPLNLKKWNQLNEIVQHFDEKKYMNLLVIHCLLHMYTNQHLNISWNNHNIAICS